MQNTRSLHQGNAADRRATLLGPVGLAAGEPCRQKVKDVLDVGRAVHVDVGAGVAGEPGIEIGEDVGDGDVDGRSGRITEENARIAAEAR